MNIQTEEGIAKPMPLSDIQENNRRLKNLERQQLLSNIRGYLWLALVISLLIYTKLNNILNNIVAKCVC